VKPSPSASLAEASILLILISNRFLVSSDLTIEISITFGQSVNKRWDRLAGTFKIFGRNTPAAYTPFSSV
jgi:hypothetical protein